MRISLLIAAAVAATLFAEPVHADTFGMLSPFEIDFVTVGNPGNTADTTGAPNPAGKVDYSYRIGQFEISEDMINKANTQGGLGITHDNRGDYKPVTNVSWLEAAQFVNWLNTDSGITPAYKFSGSSFELWTPGDAGYNPDNLYRNSHAKYFLPSVDEWYKAAYYDPSSDVYYNYPTTNGLLPTAVASGTAANTAVYNQPRAVGPADITQAGGLSAYGTMAQAGNVWEWEETDFDLANDSTSSGRGVRGGMWSNNPLNLPATNRGSGTFLSNESFVIGFRVASTVPEPTSALFLCGSGALIGLRRRRR